MDELKEVLSALGLVTGHLHVDGVDVCYLEGPVGRFRRKDAPDRFVWALGADDGGVRIAMPMQYGTLVPGVACPDRDAVADMLSARLADKPIKAHMVEAMAQAELLGDRGRTSWGRYEREAAQWPEWLAVEPANGAISGLPPSAGDYDATLVVSSFLSPKTTRVTGYLIQVREEGQHDSSPPDSRYTLRATVGKPFRHVPDDQCCLMTDAKRFLPGRLANQFDALLSEPRDGDGTEARLDRILGTLRAAMRLDIVESRLGPHRRTLFDLCVGLGMGPSPTVHLGEAVFGGVLAMPIRAAARLAAFVKAEPRLARYALRELEAPFEGGMDEVARDLLTRRGVHPAAVARMGPFPTELDREDARLAAAIPIDWMPMGDDEVGWDAFKKVSWLLARIPEGYDDTTMVSSSKGRWEAFLRTIVRASGRDPAKEFGLATLERVAGELKDTLGTFERDVMLPLLRSCGLGEAESATRENLRALSARLLAGRRGLPRLVEMARKQHRARRVTIEEAEAAWETILPTREHGGISIVPLTDTASLEDEGRNGPDANGMEGLRHCVRGTIYVDRCVSGAVRIASLRKGGRRLSTAEIRLGPEPRAVQHRGHGNDVAPPEAEEALAAYLAEPGVVAASAAAYRKRMDLARMTARERAEVGMPPPVAPEEVMRIYAAWGPHLPGDHAGLQFEELERIATETIRSRANPSPRRIP